MCAGSGAGLVTAVWTVAEVIINGREGDLYGGIRDARKGIRILVELGNYNDNYLAH
jgi:hypothetical protein